MKKRAGGKEKPQSKIMEREGGGGCEVNATWKGEVTTPSILRVSVCLRVYLPHIHSKSRVILLGKRRGEESSGCLRIRLPFRVLRQLSLPHQCLREVVEEQQHRGGKDGKITAPQRPAYTRRSKITPEALYIYIYSINVNRRYRE